MCVLLVDLYACVVLQSVSAAQKVFEGLYAHTCVCTGVQSFFKPLFVYTVLFAFKSRPVTHLLCDSCVDH